ncbi:hypothetical protein ADMFC3_09700 [Geovibrio sp. ADMFC3]
MRWLIFTFLLFSLINTAFAGSGSARFSVLPAPPMLSVSIGFEEASGNKALDAEESGAVIVKVTNSGQGDAFDVKAQLNPQKQFNGLDVPGSLDIGTVPAGKTVEKRISINTTDQLETGVYKLGISVKELNGFNPAPTGIAFNTKEYRAPKLVVADMSVLDSSRNGRIEPMENVEIKARIQNIGAGDAFDVNADILPGNNVYLGGDRKSSFNLGTVASGQYMDVSFIIYTNSMIADGARVPVDVNITEKKGRFGASTPLKLVMSNKNTGGGFVTVQAAEEKKETVVPVAGLSTGVDTKVPVGLKKAGRYDVAVVIGNSRYSNAPDVDYALNDARVMKQYLIKTFGFDEGNIIYAEDASLGKFYEIFGNTASIKGKLFNYIKPGISNVFVYYAGHGAPDLDSSEAYIVPVDANTHYLSSSGYKLQTFYSNLDKMQAKKITVVIDACFSGDSAAGMLFKDISPAMVKVKKQYEKPKLATLLTSSGFSEVSSWYPEKRHSMFTYWFLKGLQGDADLNGDKTVTLLEMKKYVTDNVPYKARKLHGINQNPVVDGSDEDVLVVLK